MKTIFKLGDRVRLVRDVDSSFDEKYLKGAIGSICDVDNQNVPCVEIGNSEDQFGWNSFRAEDLEILDEEEGKKLYSLGAKVITLMERTEMTSHGDSTCPARIEGMIIDNDHYPDVTIEIINKEGKWESFGYAIEELRVIK